VGLQHRLPAEWPAAESGSTDGCFGSACGDVDDDGRGGGGGDKGGPRGDCCGHGSSSSSSSSSSSTGSGSSSSDDEDEGTCEDTALSLPGSLAWRALAAVADDEPSEPVGQRDRDVLIPPERLQEIASQARDAQPDPNRLTFAAVEKILQTRWSCYMYQH
jgi:hypothetical protein